MHEIIGTHLDKAPDSKGNTSHVFRPELQGCPIPRKDNTLEGQCPHPPYHLSFDLCVSSRSVNK